ncbi:plk plk-unclassified protein kinase [Plasmopara halstedii]|uniref:Serine/threonine-protein kinase PLK n=1 Tax=Plasmopara halstedii TaxID=4781 RepID=A0A0P1AY83_PLAHL|nr:plk plk-unclassified protein kinase [Plasmopara halstedii]CEG46225.1 plk plk-unclassified protein kinase [Plasmopara halstedii]|eukprot:XP_024582594.1 plk plk-unclassified protein kinase [Plasmopara halstedii]
MQTCDLTELLADGSKENAAIAGNQPTTATMRARHRKRSDASRRVYDSDRFKLVQSRRGSGTMSLGHALHSENQIENVGVDRPEEVAPPPASTAQREKKEPTPQPVVPDQILEAYLDAQGYIRTRTYLKGKFLGKGGFARCYELECSQTGKIYAVKVVAKSSLVKPKAKQKFTSEIKIHKSLNHPQIVQFEHFFEDGDNAYILLELCRNQSMSDLMRRRKRLSESEVRFYMRQLIEGLAYLHKNLVIHRDLKLGNLFLTSDMQLKIGDFGLAARLDNPEDRKRTMCGTPNYIAPEILSGQRGDGHSFEVDVWSTGVVMYTLLVGRPPFETDDVKATYKRIRANQYDFPDTVHISSSAQSLIRGILQSDPGTRPSLDQILKHPFVADEFVPTSLPRTALLVTPPSCKPIPFTSRHTSIDHMAKSTGMRVPPPSAASNRYPLRMRNGYTDLQRAPDPGASPLVQSLPPQFKDDVSKLPSSSKRTTCTAAENQVRMEAIETLAPFQNVLEAAYKILSQLFFLQEHRRNIDEGKQSPNVSSSAAHLVAEAQELKQICEETEKARVISPASLWISQWVDYTSKYGIGYMLSNGESGVYFNDSTKIISSADGKFFEYIERQNNQKLAPGLRVRYTMDNYDPAIKKKVTLLGHFKGYLVDARAENDEADVLENQLARSFVLLSRPDGINTSAVEGNIDDGGAQTMVFVKKWVKTRHAVLFQLSNGTIQFNFFDKSKVMLSSNARIVTYLNRDGDLIVVASSSAILTSDRPDLAKRLRYARDMLQQMVRNTHQVI